MNYFLDRTKPSLSELINWFRSNYPLLWEDMEQSNHALDVNNPNPFHIEGSVLTHTMMVCQRADIENASTVNLLCALLHDIGKPYVRDTEKDPNKVYFRGHEGVSFFYAIEPLTRLREMGVISYNEMVQCLTIISLHGILFNNISNDGEMIKPQNIINKFSDKDTYIKYVKQVRYDSLGRICTSNKHAHLLGNEIYVDDLYDELKEYKQPIDKPLLEVLIGLPGAGKSTYVSKKTDIDVIISRDTELIEYAKTLGIEGSYTDIWKSLSKEDHSKIDKIVDIKFRAAFKEKRDIIIDMTNMSKKSQKRWVNLTNKKYFCKATIFVTPLDKLDKQLKSREPDKKISSEVIKSMMKSFTVPTYDLFHQIEWVL